MGTLLCDLPMRITTYFDTPTGGLFREGISLRVRRSGTRLVQTMKLDGGRNGPFGRNEWEWPVRTEAPELDLVAKTPVAALLRETPALQPIFVTDVQRTIRTVRYDNALIEVALDSGRIDAGDATEPIAELELELKDGAPEPIYRFAAALHAIVPMILAAESKADRGWRLRTGRPRRAVKKVDIGMPDDVTAAEEICRIINGVLAHLMVNQPAAAAGDIEGVHQMRVAIRRLRAALVLFRPRLEPHASALHRGATTSAAYLAKLEIGTCSAGKCWYRQRSTGWQDRGSTCCVDLRRRSGQRPTCGSRMSCGPRC